MGGCVRGDAILGGAKRGPRLGNGRVLPDQGAFEIGDDEVRRRKLGEQIVEQTHGIPALETSLITFDRTEIGANDDGGHEKARPAGSRDGQNKNEGRRGGFAYMNRSARSNQPYALERDIHFLRGFLQPV